MSYMQDDWEDWLPMAKFNDNNTTSATTEVSPFFANLGFHPRMGFEPMANAPQSAAEINANEFANRMENLNKFLQENMRLAQMTYESYANTHRIPAPMFKVGDKVWLNAKNICTQRPSRKLDWKKLGIFKIIETVGKYAYKLDLPPSTRIYPVFHVSLLEAAANDPHQDTYSLQLQLLLLTTRRNGRLTRF